MLESITSGSDCTYNRYSTARDPSLSDIFSLTDRQPAVFMSGQPGGTVRERGKERFNFTDSEYGARYIQKCSVFTALLRDGCDHI